MVKFHDEPPTARKRGGAEREHAAEPLESCLHALMSPARRGGVSNTSGHKHCFPRAYENSQRKRAY